MTPLTSRTLLRAVYNLLDLVATQVYLEASVAMKAQAQLVPICPAFLIVQPPPSD